MELTWHWPPRVQFEFRRIRKKNSFKRSLASCLPLKKSTFKKRSYDVGRFT